jgi:hypothetical protein
MIGSKKKSSLSYATALVFLANTIVFLKSARAEQPTPPPRPTQKAPARGQKHPAKGKHLPGKPISGKPVALPHQRLLPKQLITKQRLHLTVERGPKGLEVKSQTIKRLAKPKKLARFAGPFSIELYQGHKLRDIVRFSMPLTLAAGEPTAHGRALSSALAKNARTKIVVVIPYLKELTHLILVDSLKKRRTRHQLRRLFRYKPMLAGPKRTDAFGKR